MNKRGADDFDAFCKIINDMLALFDELTDYENKKLDAIAANDVALLDKYINDEQAYLLKMRGIDSKREDMQKRLGVPELTFKQMLERFEGSERETLDVLYEKLSSKTSDLKDAISGTKRYIDLHLNSISALLEKLDGGEGTYDKKGEMEQKTPPTRFTPVKV